MNRPTEVERVVNIYTTVTDHGGQTKGWGLSLAHSGLIVASRGWTSVLVPHNDKKATQNTFENS